MRQTKAQSQKLYDQMPATTLPGLFVGAELRKDEKEMALVGSAIKGKASITRSRVCRDIIALNGVITSFGVDLWRAAARFAGCAILHLGGDFKGEEKVGAIVLKTLECHVVSAVEALRIWSVEEGLDYDAIAEMLHISELGIPNRTAPEQVFIDEFLMNLREFSKLQRS